MGIDWRALFVPTTSILEIILRGSLIYLSLFVILRLILKREATGLSLTDLLVVLLVAESVQGSMVVDETSLTGGIILVSTVIFWSYTLDWIGHHSSFLSRIMRSPPLLLVENGRMLRRNMRKELITEDELMSQIRLAGIERVEEVERVYMEGDGKFSVIRKDHGEVNSAQEDASSPR